MLTSTPLCIKSPPNFNKKDINIPLTPYDRKTVCVLLFAIQAEGKLNYVLGKFEPNSDDAQGIVNYAKLHADSEKGQVPYREWPQAIKGHFRARLPVLDQD